MEIEYPIFDQTLCRSHKIFRIKCHINIITKRHIPRAKIKNSFSKLTKTTLAES